LQKDESRLRVIHIGSSFAKGGLERFPVRLAKAQARLGVETSVLTHKEAYIYQYARKLGVDVFGAESRAQMFSWLWRQRKHGGLTVLQVNANKDLPMAVIAKRFFAKDKVRLTYRRGTRAMKPKTDPYHRLLFREVDLFIVVSKFIHDNTLQVYKVPESRVLCIHNGVDPDFSEQNLEGRHLCVKSLAFLKRRLSSARLPITGLANAPMYS